MSQTWNEVNKELHRRRDILVRRSHEISFPMDQLERNRIQSVLEHWDVPQRPTNIPELMKQFCVSAYSYAPLRNNFMKPLAEGLPTRENVAKALSRAFSKQEFLNDSNWLPERLCILAEEIQKERCFDLSSKQFSPRVVAVLLTGSRKFMEELGTGLDNFYERIFRISTPPAMWDLVNGFSKPISHVGPALVCDFFKEVGFVQYVKVDHHFGRQFSPLVTVKGDCSISPKRSFMLSQQIADAIGMTPYHLDAILYLWGRYGDRA